MWDFAPLENLPVPVSADFPAMLALPPGGVPQPVPLFALIQPDEQNRAAATLLLPNEVSATIMPMN